jgi:hypothetical protein
MNLLRSFGIKEIARTGYIAMTRGNPAGVSAEKRSSRKKESDKD